jgi:hypothetical protein
MNTQELTIVPPPSTGAIIGWNYHGRVVGIGDLGRITWSGIAKVGAATAIAGAATTIKAANVALDEISDSRDQMQARIDMLSRRNSDLAACLAEATARIEALQRRDVILRAQVTVLVAKATTAKPAAATKATRQRWTDGERDALAALVAATPAGRPGWQRIAKAMSDRFGRQFTAAAVSSQARRARPA